MHCHLFAETLTGMGLEYDEANTFVQSVGNWIAEQRETLRSQFDKFLMFDGRNHLVYVEGKRAANISFRDILRHPRCESK